MPSRMPHPPTRPSMNSRQFLSSQPSFEVEVSLPDLQRMDIGRFMNPCRR